MQIDRERLRDTFMQLVEIPSPSLREREVADEIARRVRELGYEVTEDQAGNMIGGNAGNLLVRVPAVADGPRLFLAAHMDTVEKGEEPIRPVARGHEITAREDTIVAADDKTGVAVLLELLAMLKENNIKHSELLVAFTVAEEIELLGISAMEPALLEDMNAAIVLDHSLPWEMITASPHKVSLRITVHGVGGHGAFPDRRVNAAHALATAVSRLPSGRLDEFSTCNLGVMYSGSRINVIPDHAYAEYEIRSHHKDILDFHLTRTLAVIEAAVREARIMVTGIDTGIGADRNENSGPVRKATVEVEVEACYEGYRLSSEALPVELLSRAIRKCGREPITVVAQGGSDANVLNSLGLPAVVMGCGMHGAHSSRECANLDEMEKSVEVLTGMIQG